MPDIIFYSARPAMMGDNAISGSPIDFEGDTIKCALLTNATTPVQSQVYYSSISNEVANGNGYTTGGVTLTNCSVTYDTSTATFDADDAVWTNATITARYALVYKWTGTASTSPLICSYEFTSDKSSTNGTFRVAWPANGVLRLST